MPPERLACRASAEVVRPCATGDIRLAAVELLRSFRAFRNARGHPTVAIGFDDGELRGLEIELTYDGKRVTLVASGRPSRAACEWVERLRTKFEHNDEDGSHR